MNATLASDLSGGQVPRQHKELRFMNQQTDKLDLNRRDFLSGASFSTIMALLGGKAIEAQDAKKDEAPTQYKTAAKPVNCGVIGCGQRGREILKTLAVLPNAPVVGISDTYQPMMNRAKESAPKAQLYTDYKQLLANKEVQAVILATPTHKHKDLVAEILKAGKHLYCEAPLANTVDDAREIARAAKDNPKVHFQSGLQLRSDPQRHFLLSFVRSGAAGKAVKARAQWHKKQSWRQTSPNAERERELNWRLDKNVSTGLAGEVGIHQIDGLTWFLNTTPIAVSGFGSVLQWSDGRSVPDTIMANFEFPGGVILSFEGSLANSFDADHEILYGTESAIMVRENKAWMFKEVDAPMLGWEVYARKDQFYKETGIALVANATKIVAQGDKPVEEAPFANTPLYYALENFLISADIHGTAVKDFAANFDADDKAALSEYIQGMRKNKPAFAGVDEGYNATVIAIKANEAITGGKRITFEKEWFQI